MSSEKYGFNLVEGARNQLQLLSKFSEHKKLMLLMMMVSMKRKRSTKVHLLILAMCVEVEF